MIVTSAYTPTYRGEVEPFVDAASAHVGIGDTIDVNEVPDRLSWRKNCGIKPSYILKILQKHKQPVLWVDIDGRFRATFSIGGWLAQEYDFAIWFIPNHKMLPVNVPGDNRNNNGLASGTMWFNYTPQGIDWLEAWADYEANLMSGECEKYPSKWEQQDMGDLWYRRQAAKRGPKTYRLPQQYCKVFDVPWFSKAEDHNVIIEHMQASRRLKGAVGR